MVYHSALKPGLDIKRGIDEFHADGSVVFAWDVTLGAHPYFWMADALYTEPSWRDGYEKFLSRAAQEGSSSFSEYLAALKNVIATLKIPSYVVMGKHMVRALDPPQAASVRVHGYGALVGAWNVSVPHVEALDALVKFVCETHRTVLDPCCGYGSVAAVAERFVCSDINRRCVYYVAKTYMGYDG